MIAWERRSRLPRPPKLFLALVALWALAVAATTLLARSMGTAISVCHFRAATDLPCATCGGTRATFALFGGDLGTALHFNPLITLSLLIGGTLLAIRLLTGRQLVLRLQRRGWIGLSLLLVACFVANWIYVASQPSI